MLIFTTTNIYWTLPVLQAVLRWRSAPVWGEVAASRGGWVEDLSSEVSPSVLQAQDCRDI